MANARLALGVMGFALLTGCPAQDGAERAEAGRVSRAIDALRSADNGQKSKFLEALRGEACADKEVCAVRSACLAAYELHSAALQTITRGLIEVNKGESDKAEVILSEARANLERAKTLTEDCTRVQGDLIRHRRL